MARHRILNSEMHIDVTDSEPRDAVLAGPQVAEGVWTSRSVYERVQRIGLETPIMTGVYRIVHEGQSPLDAVQDLLRRQPGNERW
jgi:glycerol-3-phosphate dehydrogenase (NAD(P)+)